MSRNYDNWERLVAAVIKKQQLWELFHAHSRSPSVLSDASDFSSSLSFNDVSLGNWIPYNLQQAPLNKSNNPALVFISDYSPVYDLEDLLKASPGILGRGTFGSVYAAKLENGTTIAVKRLNMVNNISEQDFSTHMGIIGDVKHENVAAFKAYYYSTVEKLMIYDYYSNGSVSALLHGKTGEIRANVNWKIRLRIAIGAARGISHIHAQNGGNLVHGNIKSSNIFLSSQQEVHVSDIGLASMTPLTLQLSSKCYAPEVKTTRTVSQASDVYSFGILLFELLTRKSPDLSLGRKAVDLAKLVNSVSHKGWDTKIFDKDLLFNPSIRNEMVRMLEIGISCVAKSPKKRPKMSVLVKMMEDISVMNMSNRDSVSTTNAGNQVSWQRKRNALVFLNDGNPRFDLDDLLRASAEVLGKGTFGTSYKVVLDDGIIVCVKRLRDVIVTEKEFQQHMEIIGRIGHKNVAELAAYFYSKYETLLVYDYYYHGSLSSTLQGNRYSAKRPLDWNTRLKIAVGAAKGIAHIHTQNEQKFVHGNVRASNIILDEQQHCVVSDFGLAKLTSFVSNNEGYRAPEATSNEVSQACDLYSFGVVLLELLSGKPPQTTYKGKAMSLVELTQTVVIEEWASQLFDPDVWNSEVNEEMVEMMQIAMDCVDSVSEKRPKMTDVVQMLEKFRGTVPARSRLEDLLIS